MASSPQTSMQDAFQAFMLGTSGGKKKKNKNSHPSDCNNNNSPKKPSTPKTTTTPRQSKESPSPSRHPQYQKQQQDYRAFQNLHKEWLETDDTLYALVGSIGDLRQRLFYSVQTQQRSIEKQIDHFSSPTSSSNRSQWKSYGYKPQSFLKNDRTWLQPHDFDLAIDHILLQHEKALQNIRRLLSQQSQTIDSMGRRLEFLLMNHPSYEDKNLQFHVWDCQDTFHTLAQELYRKQSLVQRIFVSVQDTLFTSLESYHVARSCHKEWRV